MRYLMSLFSVVLLSACHQPAITAVSASIQSQAALPPGYQPPTTTPAPCPSSFQAQAALPPGYRPPSSRPPASNCPCNSMQNQAILPPGVNPCK